MSNHFEIVLNEAQIGAIINGSTISYPIGEDIVKIRQSYSKDISQPLIDRENKVMSQKEISSIKSMISINNISGMGY